MHRFERRTALCACGMLLMVGVMSMAAAFGEDQPDEPVVIQRASGTWRFQIKKGGIEIDGKKYDVLHCNVNPSSTIYLSEAVGQSAALVPFGFDGGVGYSFHISLIRDRFKSELISGFYNDQVRLLSEIVEHYLELDVDFPGGDWEQLEELVSSKLKQAYATQLPDILKPILPVKLEVDLARNLKHTPRFVELHSKKIVLGSGLFHATSAYEGEPDDRLIDYDFRKSPICRLVIRQPTDGGMNDNWKTEFFNMSDMISKKGTGRVLDASDVAALFEISWKTKSPVVWAKTRYHPETGILIVQGTEDEIKIATKAFDTLRNVRTNPNPFDTLAQKLDTIAEGVESKNSEKGNLATKLDALVEAVTSKSAEEKKKDAEKDDKSAKKDNLVDKIDVLIEVLKAKNAKGDAK